ncbi:aminopeptidase P family protein [Streptomyces alkaliterrae]|uniref:Aminopeptidase P family protein n=1 Tax=Streptomyces alkaliterrae TaxID=2213162 RepID=A0A5P0YLV7_9ACTN|nr:aminopeptidase P family protein [Streptomyces alkaliterrae]MBB1256768.1 aminopeptidase P family protein [Streptomyces alkaliterrae]MBB1258282.1 aminopeptidase P family protein [Streptomyces alkaliterrae]MQS01295.1 M24 family metallopeptidase [Streptomyces alkaliterrae]
MSEVHTARRARLRDPAGRTAALVSHPANLRYLTGCAPPGAALLVGPDARDTLFLSPHATGRPTADPDAVTAADLGAEPRRLPEPGDELRFRSAGESGDPAVAAARTAADLGVATLAVEEHHLTVARHRALTAGAPHLPLADLGRTVEQQRLVKDEEEIAALRIAAEITDQALGELLESILVGRTERHLALELERRLIDHGADGPAFPTSVATGPHAGVPTHTPTDRRVEEGDFLSVRMGARYRGYCCQIGRTFVIGTAPADWQIELYDLVFAAQRAGREALAPGVECRAVDRAARQVLAAAGHGGAVETCTGHGVGLEIGEDPRLSPSAMSKLDARVPVTVEPGVHLPGRGGVRIDDTLVVRSLADGGPELLTITTKELLAL